MAEPALVADCVKAMRDAVALPVTVKHRIGIDRVERYEFVRDFVGTVTAAGCEVFVVHARNAWLKGLSPKENREVPPLRHEFAHRLKRDFPALTIVLNGGIADAAQIEAALAQVDGAMLGRAPYHDPWMMAGWDARFFGDAPRAITRDEVEEAMADYMQRLVDAGEPWWHAARHMLGLRNGLPGARRWRQAWSDQRLKHESPHEVLRRARAGAAAAVAA
jgi:tRNA-dihydrouridine synthase A